MKIKLQGYCRESINYFARMDVQPSRKLKSLLDKTIRQMKYNGIWDELDQFVFMNLHTAQASALNVKGLGPELVNQEDWFTPAYWSWSIDSNWSRVGNTLSSDGTSGYAIRSTTIWPLPYTYQFIISVILNSGTLHIDDWAAVSLPNITSSGTYTFTITPAQNSICIRSILFNGSITAMSVKKSVEFGILRRV